MGDDRVNAYAEKENLPILMEIPFDRQIAQAYSRGQMLVNVFPQWKERFQQLFTQINEILAMGKSA
jgi:MinD superfamily P-loop ATPase